MEPPAAEAGAVRAQPKARGQVPELDGIRGLAISGVMALHFLFVTHPESFVERVISKAAGYGGWGVDLFFVLSGFLITGILHDAKGTARYFKNFYARRTLRIFPLHYGVLLLVWVAPTALVTSFAPELVQTRHLQGWLWLYLTNFYVAHEQAFSIPYLSHFWSLAVEEHFYLFWPVLVAACSRMTAMRVCVAMSVFALALRIFLRFAGMTELAVDVLTPCRLDSLCVGAFLALAARGPGGASGAAADSRRWLLPSAASVFLVSLWHASPARVVEISLPVRTSLLAVFFGLVIVSAADPLGPSPLKWPFRIGFLRTLGKYSYGLYVFHGIVERQFAYRHVEVRLVDALHSHTLAFVVRALGGIGISMLVAVLSYELYEKRFLTLKHRFESKGAPKEDGARLASPVAEHLP